MSLELEAALPGKVISLGKYRSYPGLKPVFVMERMGTLDLGTHREKGKGRRRKSTAWIWQGKGKMVENAVTMESTVEEGALMWRQDFR